MPAFAAAATTTNTTTTPSPLRRACTYNIISHNNIVKYSLTIFKMWWTPACNRGAAMKQMMLSNSQKSGNPKGMFFLFSESQ